MLTFDLLAERIYAVGFPVPATYSEFGRLSSNIDSTHFAEGVF
jgi:DNA-binding ferritin-like protein